MSGFSAMIVVEHREAFAGAVGIGRQAEVERDHRRLLGAQRGDRGVAVAGDQHLEIVIGPLELGLQALVVLDDQQLGLWRRRIMRTSDRSRGWR